jgi:hypothetical protein
VKNFKGAIVIILFTTTGVFAQGDHLQPVGGIFDVYDYQLEYYSKIRKILFEGLSNRPAIRFLVLPSFTKEHVLDIEENRETKKYYLVYQEVDKMIWQNEKPAEIELKQFRKEINEESVELIRKLFLKALRQTRHSDDETFGVDGDNYYFFARDSESGFLSGTVWSPNDSTSLGRLVDVGNKLISLSKGKEKAIEITGKLKEEIERLTSELR